MKRYCLTLDLKNDPELIASYELHHRNVWPEVLEALKKAGIVSAEIYRIHTRLVMIMEVTPYFSFEKKEQADEKNPKVMEWETLMENYQSRLSFAEKGEKWVVMNKIFEL